MTRINDLKTLLRQHGTLTADLLRQHGIPRSWLPHLLKKGELIRVSRGIYTATEADHVGIHHSLAVAAQRVPKGVICLLSALRFHEIGTQLPNQVWMGLPRGARIPAEKSIHAVHYSQASFSVGIENHRIEGAHVRIYSPAKTVADCFKYRNQIGLDAAIEALRETIHARRATIADIHAFAKACRVGSVITPYLQAVT